MREMSSTATMAACADEAIRLVPRERGRRDEGAKGHEKIIDVDVFIAGQKRGTWRRSINGKGYWMHL